MSTVRIDFLNIPYFPKIKKTWIVGEQRQVLEITSLIRVLHKNVWYVTLYRETGIIPLTPPTNSLTSIEKHKLQFEIDLIERFVEKGYMCHFCLVHHNHYDAFDKDECQMTEKERLGKKIENPYKALEYNNLVMKLTSR